MLPMTREVAVDFEGPTVACPSCDARIAITPPTGWMIRSPQDVYRNLGVELAALEREELRILLLNTKNTVLRVVTAYQGNVNASLVRVGELFREAVRDNVTAVVLVHNHPSGDATPSPDDLHLTAEALAAGRLLDIEVLDHIVIASGGYTSLRDRGVFVRPVRGFSMSPRIKSSSPITLEDMTILRMDNVGIVVDDLKAAIAFFVELGLELEGEMTVEGQWVDRIVALDGVRNDIAMLRTPDGHSRLELMKFHTPSATTVEPNAPVNTLGIRRIMFAVDDIDAVVASLQAHGAELVGELVQYEDSYRLCYVRGPEGIIVALAEPLRGSSAGIPD